MSDDKRLALAYSAVDAFLFPSREDNVPLTVGEAMLCGTPVIAFPVGHVPELVQHKVTGYLASYLDVADFAKGIEWALTADLPVVWRRGLACRQTAASFHDPVKSVRRHLNVYREAVEGMER